MKKLLVIMAFVFCSALQNANARDVAYMRNNAGGNIVLTNEQCEAGGKTFDDLRRAYANTDTGVSVEGCYYIGRDKLIHAVFQDAKERVYFPKDFTIIRSGNRVEL